MFRNTITITLRLIKRHKGFAAINLGGLAVGLAVCLLISLFIRDELSFDRFHSKGDRIFRLGGATVGWPYGKLIREEYPEVESVAYMRSYPTYPIIQGEDRLYETMFYADSDFFRIFDFPLREGNPEGILSSPYSIVLSQGLADRLFGDSSALGQTVILGESLPFKVSGVTGVPERSHIQFDALLSFETLRSLDREWFDEEMSKGWLDLNVINYVLLREGTDPAQFAAKIEDLPRRQAGDYLDRWGANYKLRLEPLRRIYLQSGWGNFLGPKSDISYVRLLLVVALFLVIIAAANFINLATARSLSRAKEVGIRKVIGSNRSVLIGQLFGESLVTCLLAAVMAAGLALLMLPIFNELTAKNYRSGDLFTSQTGLVMLGLAVLISVFAGLYPAFSLSAFRPIEVLRGRFSAGRKGLRLRQGLVVIQFVIASLSIFGTLVILSQLRYMRNQDLGFDSRQVVVLDARRASGDLLRQRNAVFLEALAGHASIYEVSSVGAVPGRNGWRGQISFPEGWPEDQSLSLEYVPVDYDFEKVLGFEVIAGRAIDPSFPTDAETAVMINRAAVEAAGWESPEDSIGRGFASPGSRKPNGVVVGVLENYHHHGLQEKIEPMMFGFRAANSYFTLRVDTGTARAAVDHVRDVWKRFFPGFPMEVFFLDEDFDRQYGQEVRLMNIASTSTLLTIAIACLGLFGLTAFSAAQRVREIGVRKVLGATVPDVVKLLAFDFLKLVLIAFVAAAPLGYILMRQWLENFAFRPGIGPLIFVLNGVLLFSIAAATMSVQAIKAAVADPARSLRHE